MEVRTVEVDGARWVVKTAGTTDEAARLQREAGQLRRAAHPGVVEMATSEAGAGAELWTRHAGASLRQRGPMPAAELCGLGAAVATVLADLHDIGIVHGAVTADHILIDSDGRPLLCGFGASTSIEEGDASLDARGLTAALSDLLGPDAPRRLVRVLRQDLSVRRSAATARALATALAAAMPDRRLPAPAAGAADPILPAVPALSAEPDAGVGTSDAGPAARRRRSARAATATAPASRRSSASTSRPLAVALLVVVVGAVVAGAVLGFTPIGGHRRATAVACPPADRSCRPVPVHDGAFVTASGTFATGLPDPIVVLGRWHCGTASLPAALDPRTGRIWTWPTWADPSRAVTATAVPAPSGATTLRVRPEASGCDRLEVIDAAGTTTALWSEGQHGA